jgi:MFS family permease
MSGLFLSAALSAAAIVGLLVAGVAPSFRIIFGLAAAAAVVAVISLARSLAPREEDSEPEIRPPQHRTGPLRRLKHDGHRATNKEENA